MSDYQAPSAENINRYVALIRFLDQVRSLTRDINEETEQFNRLLGQQTGLYKRTRFSVEDLTTSLSELEEVAERTTSILNRHESKQTEDGDA